MIRQTMNAGDRIRLTGESDGKQYTRTFGISRVMNEGGSAVCYRASHSGSSWGQLKEFYPPETEGAERDGSGVLTVQGPPEALARFERQKQEYLAPLEQLLRIQKEAADPDLDTFIPICEIYRGETPQDGKTGTVYVWIPEPEVVPFENICEAIHRHPKRNAESSLIKVLKSVESLTKCIRILHRNGLYHRDINPSNFGFAVRNGEMLIQQISLFDVDTLCAGGGWQREVIGTQGFSEPGYFPNDEKKDIYSIGATLFYALIDTKRTRENGYLYDPAYLDDMEELVGRSGVIRAAGAGKDLCKILCRILKKCLTDCREARYDDCGELLEDLNEALLKTRYAEIIGENGNLDRLTEDQFEKLMKTGLASAVQYHLYEHPLYTALPKDETQLNVLVIGLGIFGKIFLDHCLQSGQIAGVDLNVTVVSDREEKIREYLGKRPALRDFFTIDGVSPEREGNFGRLFFRTGHLNEEHLAEAWPELTGCGQPHYVFIALGEDELNRRVAAEAARCAGENCLVSYAWEDEKQPGDGTEGPVPVLMREDVSSFHYYPEVERMAFNAHLIWVRDLNLPYETVRREFLKPYNHDSCVSAVLAIATTLHRMGIELKESGVEEAARLFAESDCWRNDRPDNRERNALVWIEQKRWVTEKLCQGWTAYEDLTPCVRGERKSETEKKHICIRKSRPDQMLAEMTEKDRSIWNDPQSDISGLDDLDQMSVLLHRAYLKAATEEKAKDLLHGEDITALQELAADEEKAGGAFQAWYECLKGIWTETEAGYARFYRWLKERFLELLPKQKKAEAKALVEHFELSFNPVLRSTRYTIWKSENRKLIENIPFVLTYSPDMAMVIPYYASCGNTRDINREFENVAAPLVVSPSRIIYLYCIRDGRDIQALTESYSYVAAFMTKKSMKASVRFVLLCSREADRDGSIRRLEDELAQLAPERTEPDVTVIRLEELGDIPEHTEEILEAVRAEGICLAEKNDTALSGALSASRFYDRFPSYRFNTRTQSFERMKNGGERLGYIRSRPVLSVSDVLSFSRSGNLVRNQPDYTTDHTWLWRLYSTDRATWKAMCAAISVRGFLPIASFAPKPNPEKAAEEEYTYIIPFRCKKVVQRLLDELRKCGIAEPQSRISGYTPDSCLVTIRDRYALKGQYDQVFADPGKLMDPDGLKVTANENGTVDVRYDLLRSEKKSLQAKDDKDPRRPERILRTLEEIQSHSFIHNLSFDPEDQTASFTFATPGIKKILTTTGRVLEIHVYQKLRQSGLFDDVVSSYEVNWKGTKVRNEFDCVMTSGFRTWFVECKAQTKVDQGVYEKLANLTRNFGINATAILIMDGGGTNLPAQKERGDLMNVVTVSDPGEIARIDRTLEQIMQGTYHREERTDSDPLTRA